MNKKFTLSLLVILIFIIGLPSVFAQTPGYIKYENTKPINALRVEMKATATMQTAGPDGIYGLDSTTYFERDRKKVTVRQSFNIAQAASLNDPNRGFIRFTDDPYSGTTTINPGFKFMSGDTIYLAFQSAHSPTSTPDNKDSIGRFQFASGTQSATNLVTSTTNNSNIIYNMVSEGNNSMSFHLVGAGTNSIVNTTHPTYAGGIDGTGVATTSINTGYLNLSGEGRKDTIILVIDERINPSYSRETQLELSNISVQPTGKWLQGSTIMKDTLLAIYGKAGGADIKTLAGDDSVVASTRFYTAGHDGGDSVVPASGWAPDLSTAEDLSLYYNFTNIDSTRGTPYADSGNLFRHFIDPVTEWRDSLFHVVWIATTPSGYNYGPGNADPLYFGGDTLWGYLNQIKTDSFHVRGWGTPDDPINPIDVVLFQDGGYNYREGTYYYWIDSNEVYVEGTTGRVPISVRHGNEYWTFYAGDDNPSFANIADGTPAIPNDVYSPNMYDGIIGGAPILYLALLPGDPAFVRWNVGFGGSGIDAEIRTTIQGKLVPTARRPHVRGKILDDNYNATAATPDGDHGALTADNHIIQPFKVTDTLTTYYMDNGDWASVPDTLFFFDADSNLVNDRNPTHFLMAVDSTLVSGTANGSRAIAKDASPTQTPWGVRISSADHQPGRSIYHWGFDMAGRGSADATGFSRVRKIRLVGALSETPAQGTADTLNSAFDDVPETFTSTTPANHAMRTAILITVGDPARATIEYIGPNEDTWRSFPENVGITITAGSAQLAGHKLRATLRDILGNVIRTAAVGMNIYSDTDPKAKLDTINVTGDAANAGAGLYVYGRNADQTSNRTAGRRPSARDFSVDTMYLFVRDTEGTDDLGAAQASFRPVLEECDDNVIRFAFTVFPDSGAASYFPGEDGPDSPITPFISLGGPETETYKITIGSSGSSSLTMVVLSSSVNNYQRTNLIDDSYELVASRSADENCGNPDQTITFRVRGSDGCNRQFPLEVSQVEFLAPQYVKGGWGAASSWTNRRSYEAILANGPVTDRYPISGLNYWGKTRSEANGKGIDSTGSWKATEYGKDDDGMVYRDYLVPDMSEDTVRITVKVAGNGEQSIFVATKSGEPETFRLFMRPGGTGDTSLQVSRGVTAENQTTFAYGVLRDCNNELVSSDYDAYTTVYWRLNGASRYSAFLFNPMLTYGVHDDSTKMPDSILDSVSVYFRNNTKVATFRGQREWPGGINSNNGRAYVGINSDIVGGTESAAGNLIFPIEKEVGKVIPSGTKVFESETNTDGHTITKLFSWINSDNENYTPVDAWRIPHGLNALGQEVPVDDIEGVAPNYGSVTTTTNAHRLALRGWNELTANAYYYNPNALAGEPTYKVLLTTYDTTSTLKTSVTSEVSTGVMKYIVKSGGINQIAWIDGTGDYFDEPKEEIPPDPGLNFLSLHGRQAAELRDYSNTGQVITTRNVIKSLNKVDKALESQLKEDDTMTELAYNSWSGGRNHAGRVDTLYARVYDMFGNPASYLGLLRDSITITKGDRTKTTNNPLVGNLDSVANANNRYYNQTFVGASAGNVGYEALLASKFMGNSTSRVRDAVGIAYQALSHTGTIAGENSFGRPNTHNVTDEQRVQASVVGKTLADIGIVLSKPTGPVAYYTLSRVVDSLDARVGEGGHIVEWTAYDNVDEYPYTTRLLWYDYRVTDSAVVGVATDGSTSAPILDLYKGITANSSVASGLYGYVSATNVGGTYQSGALSLLNWAVPDTTLKIVDKNGEETEFLAKQYSVTNSNTQTLTGLSANYIGRTGVAGFVSGVARTRFTSLQLGEFNYAIFNPFTGVAATTEGVLWDNPIDPTKNGKFRVTLPGRIHWVSMANPNAADLSKEATEGWPLRRNYDGEIDFDPGVGLENWNNHSADGRNPRSYAEPVDTVFVNKVFEIQVRTYDRYGNRNTIDSIWVSATWDNGNFNTNWGGSTSEVLLDQDPTNEGGLFVEDNRFDLLRIAPVPLTPDDDLEYKSRIWINYPGHNAGGNSVTTMNNTTFVKPDLNPLSQIVAYRNVYVKTLSAPGEVVINTTDPDKQDVVRVGEVVCEPSWTQKGAGNVSADVIKYTIYFSDAKDGRLLLTKPDAGQDITDTKFVLDDDEIKTKFGLGNGNWNRDVKWYVKATNTWGMETESEPVVTTFELNKAPEAFTLVSKDKGTAIVKSPTDAVNFGWNTPHDLNGIWGHIGVGAPSYEVEYYGTKYTLDTLFYKLVFEIEEDDNGDPKEYPAGSNATIYWDTLAVAGYHDIITITAAKAQEVLLGDAETVSYKWYVLATDRGITDDEGNFDDPEFVTKSDEGTITFSKIGTAFILGVDAAHVSTAPATEYPVVADLGVSFTLTAYEGTNLETATKYRSFNIYDAELKLTPDGANITGDHIIKIAVLDKAGDVVRYLTTDNGSGNFILKASDFEDGEVTLNYHYTKANEPVSIVVQNYSAPAPSVLAVTGVTTNKFVGLTGPAERLAVSVSRNGSTTVYRDKAMEVVISPSDKYGNEITQLTTPVTIKISARYPDEVVTLSSIGGGSIFGGERTLHGKTYYFVRPVRARNDQYVEAWIDNDLTTLGRSNSFTISEHIPSKPDLTSPGNGQNMAINTESDMNNRETFTWTEAIDPVNTPLVSTVNPSDIVNDVDIVRYSVHVKQRRVSEWAMPDSVDTDRVVYVQKSVMYNLAYSLGGQDVTKGVKVDWYVIATDGVFESISDSRELIITPDKVIAVEEPGFIPEAFALAQNYPNPFNPTTQIQYDIPSASDVKVVIYNILGQPVRTLVNETNQAAARYTITWDGKNDYGQTVATGVYIYQIKAGEFSATKKMNLLK